MQQIKRDTKSNNLNLNAHSLRLVTCGCDEGVSPDMYVTLIVRIDLNVPLMITIIDSLCDYGPYS